MVMLMQCLILRVTGQMKNFKAQACCGEGFVGGAPVLEGRGRLEGFSLAFPQGRGRREGFRLAFSKGRERREGFRLAFSQGRERRDGFRLAFPQGRERREGFRLAFPQGLGEVTLAFPC